MRIYCVVKSCFAHFYKKWLKINSLFSDCTSKECLFASASQFTKFLPNMIRHSTRQKLAICSQCLKKGNYLHFFTKSDKEASIFSLLQKISDIPDWYNLLFLGPLCELDSSQNTLQSSQREILDSYQIISAPLYTVNIYSNTSNESILEIRTDFGQKSKEFYATLLSTFGWTIIFS